MKYQIKFLCISGLSLLSCAAQASLTDNGDGLIYDDVRSIARLQRDKPNPLAQSDANVNQSRVITLDGGDITWWTALGSIDAGKGAKSAISAPVRNIASIGGDVYLPVTQVDERRNIVATFPEMRNIVAIFPPRISDSGIRTIGGDLYLVAPVGLVDAGEGVVRGSGLILTASIPVPAAVWLFCSGLLGVLGLASKKRSL